jgi:3-isopropylmalate dehydrogenase
MEKTVLVMAGEGIGPEIVREGSKVLEAAAERFGLRMTLVPFEVGLPAIARTGKPLPDEAADACRELCRDRSGAILFGAVSDEPIGVLRKEFDLFANLRPIRAVPALLDISPLTRQRIAGGDMPIVRELVSGIYYGEARQGRDARGRWASQEAFYAEREIRRIVRVGLEQARRRRKRLTLVHKGNVIKGVFGLWQDVLRDEATCHPDVVVDDILVDNMAMQMVLRPGDFDVVLCSNLFGDILSDLGGGLLGSIGLLPSASLNEAGFGLYESIGGTAPDIAGQNQANPTSTILSAALLLRHTFEDERAARHVERAVYRALEKHRTADVWAGGTERVSCRQMGDVVARFVLHDEEF